MDDIKRRTSYEKNARSIRNSGSINLFLVAPLYVKADTNQSSMVSRELDRKDHLSRTDYLEKVSAGTAQVVEGVIQERGGDRLTALNAYVLGTDEHFRVWPFEMERNLTDQLGSDYGSQYDFVKINHKWVNGEIHFY